MRRRFGPLVAGLLLTACAEPELEESDDFGYFARGGLELTEVVADQGVSVPLVESGEVIPPEARLADLISGRTTFLRAAVEVPSDWVPRSLILRVQLSEPNGESQAALRDVWVEGSVDLLDPAGDLLVGIPAELIGPATGWSLGVYEADEASATEFPASDPAPRTQARALAPRRGAHVLDVQLVPIDHQFDGPLDCRGLPDLGPERLEQIRRRLAKLHPVQEVRLSVRDPMPWTETASSLEAILDALAELRAMDEAPPARHYAGVIDPCDWGDADGFAGLGYVPSGPTEDQAGRRVSITDFSDQPGGDPIRVLVHELGHNLGRLHAPCGVSGGLDPDYPRTDGRTGSQGIDVIDFETAVVLHQPDEADYMSYCQPAWVSAYGWAEVLPVIETLSGW